VGASVCMCVRESASATVVQLYMYECMRVVAARECGRESVCFVYVCVCGSVRVCVRECSCALSACVCVWASLLQWVLVSVDDCSRRSVFLSFC